MKKLRRLLFRLFLFTALIIIGIIILNTLRFSSKQVAVDAIELMAIPDAAKERLAGAVRIPTVSYEDRIDSLQFSAFRQYIDSIYSQTISQLDHFTINEYSLVYRWPGKNANLKPILLTAHLDVVPADSAVWEKAPFSGEITKDFIWGRGTLDDKLNVCGLLEAVQLLMATGYQPERSLYLAFGHDEELGGKYGAESIARRFKQQGLDFEFVLDEGMVILENALPGMKAPVAMIGTAEKGYTTLQLTAKLEKGGHSSMPPKETAIGALSKAIHLLQSHPFEAKIDGPTGQLLDYVGPEMSLPYKAIFANRWLFKGILKKQFSNKPSTNSIIRTTTAPTIINGGVKENVMPATATAAVNFRILPGESVASVIEQVEHIIGDERIHIEERVAAFSSNPSVVSGTDAFGFTVLQKTILQVYPHTVVAPALMIAATDSRHYSELSNNIYRFNPVQIQHADLARIHGIDERISVENYQHLIRFYHQLIQNSCK